MSDRRLVLLGTRYPDISRRLTPKESAAEEAT
jgi:hypothetical protein